MTESMRAASATVRVMGPIWARVPKGLSGEAGGNADRPTAIGSEVECAHPAGRRHCRATAGAARRLAWVPRIAGDARQRRIRDALPAELRRGGLAEEDRTFLAQPGDGG